MTDQNDMPDSPMAACKLLADAAQQLAEKAETETAPEGYLRIAADWLRLADEIENSKEPPSISRNGHGR